MKLICCLLLCVYLAGLTVAQGHTSQAPGHLARNFRVVCYLASWAQYRQDPVKFQPEDIDTSLCTHVVWQYAKLTHNGTMVEPNDGWNDPIMWTRLANLKAERPDLKIFLSVGGWGGSDQFTIMVNQTIRMNAFARAAEEILHRYNLDGLEIDWDFPAERGSPPSDKQRFTDLLKTVRHEFDNEAELTGRNQLQLSIAMHPSPWRIGHSYEVPDLANYVDFITLATTELHGDWENTLGHQATLYSPTDDPTDSIDYMINWILNTTIPPGKLNMALPFYGRSLQLVDPTNTHVGAPTAGNAPGGEYLNTTGYLQYTEVCRILTAHNETITETGRLPGGSAPYLVDGTRWTSYDDPLSIRVKVDYCLQHKLGGVTVTSIDQDDFNNLCGGGNFPLLHAIQQQLHSSLVGR